MIAMEGAGREAVTVAVEPARQTMRIDRVFWSHFAPNLGPGGWVTGVLLVHLGLGLDSGLLAIALGNVLGAIPVAYAAVIGPVTGLPQMEGSRRVLGRFGVRPPAFLNWVTCVGWDAVNNVPAATALIALVAVVSLAAPFWLALGVLASVQMAASVFGHDAVQWLQKRLGGVLLVAFALIAGLRIVHGGIASLPAGHANLATFVLATAILASFNLSWASYSSDYTRYLPADTPPSAIVWRTLAALLGSAVPFQVLGLLTAGGIRDPSPTAVIASLQDAAGWLGPFVLAAIALSSITGNSVNDNTAAYSLVSAGVRVPRVLAAILTASLGYVLAVAGHGAYADLYTSYLVVTLYWVAPWIGIVLADWWRNPGRDRAPRRSWPFEATLFLGVTALTIGLFSSTDLYTGPVARWLGGADIGYAVGFGLAFGITAWRGRRAGRTAA